MGAIHAGWQGLENGVIANTLTMLDDTPSHYTAWIGPAISQACYEVNSTLAQRFTQYEGAVIPGVSEDKKWLNLPLVARRQLLEEGIGAVYQSNLCTYQHAGQFYSHRRATHQGDTMTGRMVSVIGIA